MNKQSIKDFAVVSLCGLGLLIGTGFTLRNINNNHNYTARSTVSKTISHTTGISEWVEYSKSYLDGSQVAEINSGNSIIGTKKCFDLDGDNSWDIIIEDSKLNDLSEVLVSESEDSYSRQRFADINKKLNNFNKKYF